MRLGIGSYSLAWAIGVPGHPAPRAPLDHVGLLETAIRHEIGVVQYADNLPLNALGTTDLDRLLARAREHGVALEVGTRGIAPDTLRQNLALALRVGSSFVRVVIDSHGDEPTPDEAVARLRPLVAEFARVGVALAIENHDRFTARTLAHMVEALGPEHVGICLDTVNSFGALEGPEIVVPTLAPYTRNLHVKDFTVRRVSHQMGFVVEGCPAGQGRLDLPALLPQLPQDISAILELWTPPAATPEETAEKERSWFEESLRYLKRLEEINSTQ